MLVAETPTWALLSLHIPVRCGGSLISDLDVEAPNQAPVRCSKAALGSLALASDITPEKKYGKPTSCSSFRRK